MTGQLTLFGHPCPVCRQHHLRQPAGQPVTGRPIPPGTPWYLSPHMRARRTQTIRPDEAVL